MASNSKKSRKSLNNSAHSDNEDDESSRSSMYDRDDSERKNKEQFGHWECTVCTFQNKQEAFKCLMCDTRKGTSTRKPRLNPSVVQQQTLVQKLAVEVERQKKQRNAEAQSSPDPLSTPYSSTGSNFVNNNETALQSGSYSNGGKQQNSLLHRRMTFRDSLVVRSSAKKTIVTVDGKNFTITEFKPRISSRGRKKSTNGNNMMQ
uniref:RanBP2-type domain-containing protein n=1 Tax=Meloidogyne enterolobii TaxID=390850 RepID=A0A6V7XQ42_MELEN|nr:unnamed protein product [Meloidogyne enterolobii]